MTKKEIYQLLKNGYKEMIASGDDNPFLVFYTNVGMSLIYVMCGMASRYKEEEYRSLKQSFDTQIKKLGGDTKSFLVLSVDSDKEDFLEQMAVARQVMADNKFVWIFDDKNNVPIVEETQIEEFFGLRRVLEGAQNVSDEEAEKVIEKSYYENEYGKVTEKPETKNQLPKAALTLVIINTIVFLISYFTKDLLYRYGAGLSSEIHNPASYYRLFTSLFIHEDVYHLFSNMLLLGVVAFNVEKILKSGNFVICYFLAGLLGNIGEMVVTYINGESVMFYGASGAVLGMVGSYIALLVCKKIKNIYASGLWIALGIIYMLLSGFLQQDIADAAHIVGFVSGFFITLLINVITNKKKGRTDEN